MKLLTKTSLYYLLFSIPVLLLAGIVSYFIIISELRVSNDELLQNRLAQVERYLQANDSVSVGIIVNSGEAKITLVSNSASASNVFSDTSLYDTKENEFAPFRLLNAVVKTKTKIYSVQLFRSTIEYQELFTGFFFGLLIILLLSAFAFFIINYFVSRNLWKPFFQIVEVLKRFRVSDEKKPRFPESSVSEFKQLSESMESMTEKLLTDFRSQKQFTENASHEMQTPLAVMQSKIDLLFQSDKLREEELEHIKSLDDSVKKLSRLNKSLLLLSKIENKQYLPDVNVSLNKIVQQSFLFFADYFEMKEITLEQKISIEVTLHVNVDLCEILVNNLLQNALRHSTKNGKIIIELTTHELVISNSATGNALNPTEIFKRFHKDSNNSESLGLGLSIAQQIAEVNGMELRYKYENNLHVFTLRF